MPTKALFPVVGMPGLYKVRDPGARGAINWLRRQLAQLSYQVSSHTAGTSLWADHIYEWTSGHGVNVDGVHFKDTQVGIGTEAPNADIEVYKTDAEIRVTDITNDYYSRIVRGDSATIRYAQVQSFTSVGQALDCTLPGVNALHVDTGFVLSPNETVYASDLTFTVLLWVKPAADGSTLKFVWGNQAIGEQGFVLTQRSNASGGWHFLAGIGNQGPDNSVDVGVWQQLIIVWDSDIFTIYKNGGRLYENITPPLYDFLVSRASVWVGDRGSGTEPYANGYIDEFRLYPYAFTANQARMAYEFQGPEYPDGATIAYHFDNDLLDWAGTYDATGSNVIYDTGVVLAGPSTVEPTVWTASPGIGLNEEGFLVFGDPAGRTGIDGVKIGFLIGGIEFGEVDSTGDLHFDTLDEYRTDAGVIVEGVKMKDNSIETVVNISVTGAITVPNTGLHLLDTDASHDLIIKPGSDLSADRILTLTTGDADRMITLQGNPTLDDWFDQSVKIAASPTFAGLTLSGAIATPTTITTSGLITSGTNIVIADGGYIGSVSDTDAIQIEADGDVVFSQDITVTGTTTLNAIAYTWPATDAAGVLTSDGAGGLTWGAGDPLKWMPQGAKIVTVGVNGCDYTTVTAAMAAIVTAGDASASVPYVIYVMPGVTSEGATAITMASYTHIVGIDRHASIISGAVVSGYTIIMAADTSISNCTVVNAGASGSAGVLHTGARSFIDGVTINITNTSISSCLYSNATNTSWIRDVEAYDVSARSGMYLAGAMSLYNCRIGGARYGILQASGTGIPSLYNCNIVALQGGYVALQLTTGIRAWNCIISGISGNTDGVWASTGTVEFQDCVITGVGTGDAVDGGAGDVCTLGNCSITGTLDTANVTFTYGKVYAGTTTFNAIAYTWPVADAAGVLTSDGAGALSWGAGATLNELLLIGA